MSVLNYKGFLDIKFKNELIDKILTTIEPTLEKLMVKYEENFYEETGRYFTEFQKENTILYLVFDMIRSIEKYTKTTDKLIYLSTRYSNKGNLEIIAKIERDEVIHNFSTEVIIAGGYNIQKAHYRYITKTTLPQTNNTELTNIYSEKIKKLNKKEKLQKEIEYDKNIISSCEKEISESIVLTDDEIIDLLIKGEHGRLLLTTWNALSDDCYAKQNYTKESWEIHQKEYVDSCVDSWKRQHIYWKQDRIKSAEISIKKSQEKLNKL
jgi:hypothetical protein